MDHEEQSVARLRRLIPDTVWEEVKEKQVIHAGWGGGPAWILRETMDFDPPVHVDEALYWLAQDYSKWHRCHLLFADRTVLWLNHNAFHAYHRDDVSLRASGIYVDTASGEKQIEPDEDENGHR